MPRKALRLSVRKSTAYPEKLSIRPRVGGNGGNVRDLITEYFNEGDAVVLMREKDAREILGIDVPHDDDTM